MIESSGDRRRATHHKSDVLTGRQMVLLLYRKPRHRADDYLATAPKSAHVVRASNDGATLIARLTKSVGNSRCMAPYWLNGCPSPPVEAQLLAPCAACTFTCHHYVWYFTFNYRQFACRRCPASSTSIPGFKCDEQFLLCIVFIDAASHNSGPSRT